MRTKIGVIGAGNVGSATADHVLRKELGDVALVDIVEGFAAGKALDLRQSLAVSGIDAEVQGSTKYDVIEGAEVVVVTAGLPRQPGMSRSDLLETNRKIVTDVASNVKRYAPKSKVIVVTNPLDAMAYVMWKETGFQKNHVMGMAGELDSARFRTFLAIELNESIKGIDAMVLGGHGDTMVPILSSATIRGIPITNFIKEDRLNAIVDRTRNGGGEIVKLLGKGSAFYAPGACSARMVDSIVRDKRDVIPCACYLEGQYGFSGVFSGVPAILGKNGIERIVEFPLTAKEKEMLKKSVDDVKELVGMLGK